MVKGFKEIKKWSEEETDLLKHLFEEISLSTRKYSKYKKIREEFVLRGFNRSEKSISRKAYRLGLKNYEIINGYSQQKCSVCGTSIMVNNRYINRENRYCDICSEKKRRSWSSTEKGKLYHKRYLRDWKKKDDRE